MLLDIFSKFGRSPHFLAVLCKFHDGMTANIVIGGHESDPFPVNAGVKQGCVLAPVIDNLLLVAITVAFWHDVSLDDGISINYHLDSNLSNIRRLRPHL